MTIINICSKIHIVTCKIGERMRKNIFIILAVIAALILGRMFLSHADKTKSAKARAGMMTPSVTVEEVGERNVTRQFQANARIMSKYRVDVLARISGYLTKSYFKEGDYVKAGQILFEIEPQEYAFAASKAKAQLDNARSQHDYYEKQLQRYQELVREDYVAKADYDNVLAQRNAYRAQVDNAESAYRDAQRNLGYTHVKSPVDGRVGIIDVTVGNYVSMNSGALTTINSSDPMYVTFPLNSKDYAELVRIDGANTQRDVELILSTGQKYELKGVQDFFDNKVEETTGTITLRATFPNPKDELIQGDFGRVIIYSKQKDNMPVVPQSATMENQEGLYVYVLDEQNLPKIAYIKTMGQTEDNMWIVSEGIKVGDKIITNGLQKVVQGQKVNIVKNLPKEEKPAQKPNLVQKLINKLGKKS